MTGTKNEPTKARVSAEANPSRVQSRRTVHAVSRIYHAPRGRMRRAHCTRQGRWACAPFAYRLQPATVHFRIDCDDAMH